MSIKNLRLLLFFFFPLTIFILFSSIFGIKFFTEKNEIQKNHIREKILFGLQHNPQINLNWNNYYNLAGFSYQFFNYITDLYSLDPDLRHVQLISSKNTILFDSDELKFGKYELITPRKIEDSTLILLLKSDTIVTRFVKPVSSISNLKKGSQQLELLIPYVDPLLGKLTTLRLTFTLDRLKKKLMHTAISYIIFILLIVIISGAFIFFIYKHYLKFQKQFDLLIETFENEPQQISRDIAHIKKLSNSEIRFFKSFFQLIERLIEAHQRQKFLFDENPIPIFYLNKDMIIDTYNQAFAFLAGMDPIIKKRLKFDDLFPTISTNGNPDEIFGRPSTFFATIRLHKKNQQVKEVSLLLKLFPGEANNSQMIGFILDQEIKSRNIGEQKEILEIYEKVIDTPIGGFLICDELLRVSMYNRNILPYLDQTFPNPAHEHLFLVLPEISAYKPDIEKIIENDSESFDFEFKINRENSEITLYGSCVKIKTSFHSYLVVLIRNCADPARRNTEQGSYKIELITLVLQKILNEIADINKDIKELEALKYIHKEDNEQNSTRLISLLKRTETSMNKLKKLTAFPLSAIQANIEIEKIEIIQFTKKIINRNKHLMDEKNIKYELNIREDKIYIHNNSQKIEFIIEELLQNAITNSKPGGKILIHILRIENDLSSENSLQIQISDTGLGIPLEFQDKIFEPFFSLTKQKNFAGLGLFYVMTLLQSLSGKISLQSKVGKGTTFYISLPLNIKQS
ncbi:MAG: hypothetical protein Kow00108_03720 [Calditrichia bacterium]